ncbi:MAG: sugar-binding protein [bacterium]
MKSKIFISMVIPFIVLWVSNLLIAKSQTMSGDTLLVPKASISPEIDGEMDEIWHNVTKIRNLTYVYDTEPDNWLDLFFWFRVMWDDEYFYLFVVGFDDETNTNNDNAWERDGFENFIDGDTSKNSQDFGYDDIDIHLRWVYGESSGNPGTANAIHAFKDTDFGYNFELAIPTAELPLTFKAEHVFGFDLEHNDNDGNSRQHIGKWWSSNNDNRFNPSLFGTAKLIDREVSNILEINRTAFSPEIDGNMDELWKFMPEISNNKYCKLGTFTYKDLEDWNDLIYNYRTMWDNENFYLFVNVLDNDRNTSAYNSWENDSFEIYFDGDNSKNSQVQGYDTNDVHYRWVYQENSGNPGTPNSEHAWQDTDDGYNFELRIPVEDLPFGFSEDHIFGFELQLNDNDYGTCDKIAKWWSESNNSYLDPSLFGTAKFTDRVINKNMYIIITSPQQNESFIAGDDITITAEVTILEGTVTKVEFFDSDIKIGEDTRSPYSITWENIIEGEYYFYAKATDNQDNEIKSSPVKITVQTNPNLEPAKAPEFSIERGFYETSFDVNVYSQTFDSWIKYTFDGSDPRISWTALSQPSPATIKIDPESTEGQRGQNPGVVLRACTASPGYSVSEVVTHTYLFYEKVKLLSADGRKPGPGWPSPTRSGQWMVYGMDPNVLNDPRYKDLIEDALFDIPTISMTHQLGRHKSDEITTDRDIGQRDSLNPGLKRKRLIELGLRDVAEVHEDLT